MQTDGALRGRVDEWFDGKSEEMLADLTALINIKSVCGAPTQGAPYGNGAREALEKARGIMEKLGFASEVFDNCVAVTGAEDARLGILVHVDVVDASPADWQTEPFSADIRNADEYGNGVEPTLYGRGAADDKGPAVAAMYALRCALDLAGELPGGVRLIVGSAEEIGCVDVNLWLEKNTPPSMVFSPDSGFPVVNTEKGRILAEFGGKWEKSDALPCVTELRGGATANIIPDAALAVVEGVSLTELEVAARKYSAITGAEIKITAESGGAARVFAAGRASHASMPTDSCNAQTALLAMLASLPLTECASTDAIRALVKLFPHGETDGGAQGLRFEDDVSGVTTLGFDVLTLTETGFTAKFDARTPCIADSADLEGITRKTLEAAGFEVRSIEVTESHHTPEAAELVQTLLEVYRDFTGDNSPPIAVGGSTYVHGIPGGVAFGPELAGINTRIHGRDEFIGVRHLLMIAKIYTMAILRLAG